MLAWAAIGAAYAVLGLSLAGLVQRGRPWYDRTLGTRVVPRPTAEGYALTSTGSEHLRVVGAQWVAVTERVSALLGAAAPGPTQHER